MLKTVLFQTIQFYQRVLSSIQYRDRTLSSATIPCQSGPGNDGNEEVLHIPQTSNITGTSPSACLVFYPGQTLSGVSYPSAEMQSVYYTAPADWEIFLLCNVVLILTFVFISQTKIKFFTILLNQSRPGFELVSPCPFPTTITTTPRPPPFW